MTGETLTGHRSFSLEGQSNREIALHIADIVGGIRRIKKLSFNQARILTGCAYGMVRRIEEGENTLLSRFFMLAEAYGVTFSVRYLGAYGTQSDQLESGWEKGILNQSPIPYLDIVAQMVKSVQARLLLTDSEAGRKLLSIESELKRVYQGKDIHLFELFNILRVFDIALDVSFPSTMDHVEFPKTVKDYPGYGNKAVKGNSQHSEERITYSPETGTDREILLSIAAKITELRERRGKSLSQMAKTTGHNFGSLRRIELASNMYLKVFLVTASMYDVYFELRYLEGQGDIGQPEKWKTSELDARKSPIWLIIGVVVAGARETLDINQTQAAERFGFNRNELSRIENGSNAIRTDTFLRLLRAFRIELVMVCPGQHKAQPFDRLNLPSLTFKPSDDHFRERLLEGNSGVKDIMVEAGAVFYRVRSSRRVTLRDAGAEIGIDNSKLAKIEKGEINVRVGTFLEISAALGVRVELVYEVLPEKRQKAQYGSKPSELPIQKKIDLTRTRTPYMLAVGRIIKAIRKEEGDSLRDYNKVLGIDNSKIAKIEKGRIDVTMTTFGHILKTLGISLELEYSFGDYPPK